MKRSEMIKILSPILICPHMVIQPGVAECFEPKAKRILELLEKHGMLPPFHPTKHDWTAELTPTGNIDYGRRNLNEWESEDEKE